MRSGAIVAIAIGIVVIIGVLVAVRTTQQEDTLIPESIFTQSSSQQQTEQVQCDPSYPDFCIPPNLPDLDCGEIQYSNFRVLPPDRHGFDRGNDGIGCEG